MKYAYSAKAAHQSRRFLKVSVLLSVFLAFVLLNPPAAKAQSPCLTNSIWINTGYNPVTKAAVPGGFNGYPAVPDSEWTISYESAPIATDLIYTTFTEVPVDSPADVVDYAQFGGWVQN